MTLMAGSATTATPGSDLSVSADEFEVAHLERLLATEQPTALWWADLARLVDRLTDRLWEHRTAVEGPGGLHAELLEVQPRLAPAVERLELDHADMADRLVAARTLIGECAGDPDMVPLAMAEIGEIHDRLVSHQKRAATVVHDAHCVDIGGE